MVSPEAVSASLLKFSEGEFASAPEVDVDAREEELLELDFLGIAIGAPGQVTVDAVDALPVAVALRTGGIRDWDVPVAANTLLVACDAGDGAVHVAACFASPKDLELKAAPPSPLEQRPTDDELEGEGAQITWVDGRRVLDVPWRAGHWTLTAIYFDWVSNSVSIDLFGGDAPPELEPRPVDPIPGAERPTYRPLTEAPYLESEGVEFTVAFGGHGEGQSLVVTGAFAGARRPYMEPESGTVVDGGDETSVRAAVPMTLLVCRVGWTSPLRFDWNVPSYGSPDDDDPMVTGQFQIDAFDGRAVDPLPPGECAVYLVFDGAVYGPRTFTVES